MVTLFIDEVYELNMNFGISSIQPRTFFFITSKGRLLCLGPGPFATQMFQLPSVITMTIAATRTYRSLLNFAGGSTNMYYFL